MRLVRQIMGMPISIDIPETGDGKVFKAAFERLIQIDERFSTYKKASEVSRFRDGERGESELSPELALVIKNCRDWEKKTGGFFSAWADGLFDPSGYVKGWAIAETGKVIEEAGFKTYCVGAGGDILARSAGAKKWRIGIQDPTDKAKILNKLSISNGAVCTSGNYARGNHIINPKTRKPAIGLKSVTIVGPNIIAADVLATAVFAAGPATGPKLLNEFPAYEAHLLI